MQRKRCAAQLRPGYLTVAESFAIFRQVTGVGGACAALGYDPPAGYWCNSDPPRGATYTTRVPSALNPDAATAFDGRAPWAFWKPNTTVVNAFREGLSRVCRGLFSIERAALHSHMGWILIPAYYYC